MASRHDVIQFMVSQSMPGDCVVLSVGDDSDDDDDNDVEVVIIQDSDTDITEDSLSDDEVLVLLTDSDDDSDFPEELPEFSYEIEDFAALNNQVVSCLASLKRGNPDSEEVESMPLCKKGRLSLPEDNCMENNASEDVFRGNRLDQVAELERYCQNLHELTEIIQRQIYQLCEIVSEMQRSLERSQMLPCGDGNPYLPAERQENDAETSPGGIYLQSAASPELLQLVPGESPPLPRIVATYSLQPSHDSGSPSSRLTDPSIFIEGDESTNIDLSSAQDSLAELTADLPQAESSLPNNFETVRYSTISNSMNPDTALPSLCIPVNFETPGEAETSLASSTEIEHYPTLLENGSGQDTVSSVFIPPNFETNLENDTPVMNHPPFLAYDSDEDASYIFIPSDFESSTEMSSEAETHANVIKNDSDQQTDSEPFFLTSGFGELLLTLVPVEVLMKEENSTENRPETMNHPTVLGNNSSQASSSSSVLMPSNFGYLGDPRRNVRMLDIHLMAVQKKAIPRHAACYLVRILFSKEILISSSVGISCQGCQSLDPNKMAAIREHLAEVFPNYDLSEHGEEWQACISNINSLIHNLCSRRTPKTDQNNGGPTKPERDSNDKRDGDDNASSAQVSQQAAISETREHGNSPQNSRALPEGIQEPSTDGAGVSYETLEYLGDPCRNIQMPKSLLITAKEKSRPELSARYLILSLFTEEVLISSVHGSLGFGVNSLDANKINALREFLQDIYPTCDLSENGYDWKLCVMAINSCIHSLRYDPKRSTAESQSPPATTPSTESKPKDTDLAD
ncbi:BEN domain-containing protein 2 [Moschus berezovskii]|uniref:BEN domain-containing protein 2 n=1 Tax=Moschus berezovskii TaxID=68408 RepID=UPI002444E395|nr:BEN domain-containing protein 2 [Moschus berezovskii]